MLLIFTTAGQLILDYMKIASHCDAIMTWHPGLQLDSVHLVAAISHLICACTEDDQSLEANLFLWRHLFVTDLAAIGSFLQAGYVRQAG